jgi:hypothetical protein
VVVAVNGPVEVEPLRALLPLQPPEAVQLVALVELHDRLAAWPLLTDEGVAARLTVGAEALTETTAEDCAEPPLPAHDRLNVDVEASAPVDCEPLGAFEPPHAPDAVQLVAFVELQVSVEAPPEDTDVGFAVIETVGASCETIAVVEVSLVPPGPVHVSTYHVVEFNGPVDSLPLGALVPLHAAPAVQLVALVELQESVVDWPALMLAGLAENMMLGGELVAETVAVPCPVPPAPVQESV